MSGVTVLSGGVVYENKSAFEINADLFSSYDSFSFSGISPEKNAPSVNKWVKVVIDNNTVMTGIITQVQNTVSKEGTVIRFSGVDLCGWLMKANISFTKEYEAGFSVRTLLNEVIADLPFKRRIWFAGADKLSLPQNLSIETGLSVEAVINAVAAQTNSIFWGRPDGGIQFGKIASGGNFHSLTVGTDKVSKTSLDYDITNIVDSVELQTEDEDGEIFVQSAETLLPISVGFSENRRVSSEKEQLLHIVKNRANEIRQRYLTYCADTVGFYCGNGKLWDINKPCKISDSFRKPVFNANLITVKRTFNYSRRNGRTTSVEMALPAVY